MQYTATISSKGQITLPAKIRRSLNLDSGDKITITKSGQVIRIAPDNFEDQLEALRSKTARHIASQNIGPLSIDDMNSVIDSTWADSSVNRHKRSII